MVNINRRQKKIELSSELDEETIPLLEDYQNSESPDYEYAKNEFNHLSENNKKLNSLIDKISDLVINL